MERPPWPDAWELSQQDMLYLPRPVSAGVCLPGSAGPVSTCFALKLLWGRMARGPSSGTWSRPTGPHVATRTEVSVQSLGPWLPQPQADLVE